MDVAFSLQHLLLVPLMVMLKWSSFPLFGNLKFVTIYTKQYPYDKVGLGHERILLSERLEAK
jgi:hypothetical protein